jgi:hypothetical protein
MMNRKECVKVLSWSVYGVTENLNQDNQCHCQNTSQKHEPTCLVPTSCADLIELFCFL